MAYTIGTSVGWIYVVAGATLLAISPFLATSKKDLVFFACAMAILLTGIIILL